MDKNCIVNLRGLTQGIQLCLMCRNCQSNNVEVQERVSIGVSTVLQIVCHHCHTKTSPPSPSDVPEKVETSSSSYPVIIEPKTTPVFYNPEAPCWKFLDFQLNVQALISCLHIGCGPAEVGLIVANLNIEKAGLLANRYYYYIDKLSVHIRESAEMFCHKHLRMK